MAIVEDYGHGFMKAVIAVVAVAAALVTGFTIPIALAAHTSSAAGPATCQPHRFRHQHHVLCRSSSPSPTHATASSSPSAQSTSSPTPAVTSSAPSPSPASTSSPPSPGGTACVTREPSGNCGPYDYPQITNSNGFDTYVANNCWADPSCQQAVTAHDPGNWSLSAHEPAGNTAVMTYPNVQQLMTNYSGDGTWSGSSDTPISGLAAMTSTYTETMPHNSGTIAQAAWDIWLSNNGSHPNEVMVWVDNVNRGSAELVERPVLPTDRSGGLPLRAAGATVHVVHPHHHLVGMTT